jgi:hypothetical protein
MRCKYSCYGPTLHFKREALLLVVFKGTLHTMQYLSLLIKSDSLQLKISKALIVSRKVGYMSLMLPGHVLATTVRTTLQYITFERSCRHLPFKH